jgi:hypothetical protein
MHFAFSSLSIFSFVDNVNGRSMLKEEVSRVYYLLSIQKGTWKSIL